MKNWKMIILMSAVIWSLAVTAVFSGDFDGSIPLLCSVANIYECTPESDCHRTTIENVSLPPFLKVDVQNRKAMPARGAEGRPASEIKRVERVGGKLILQGADAGIDRVREGLGWTAAISEETGKMVLTASGEEVGFVLFGACIPY